MDPAVMRSDGYRRGRTSAGSSPSASTDTTNEATREPALNSARVTVRGVNRGDVSHAAWVVEAM